MRKLTIKDFEETFRNRRPKSMGLYRYYSVLVPLVESMANCIYYLK